MMKRLFGGLLIVGLMLGVAPKTYALPYGGPSVSISKSQFWYDASTYTFGAAATNDVVAFFFDSNGNDIADFGISGQAFLEVTPIDFSGGFLSGNGGGFRLYDSSGSILSGSFGSGSTLTSTNGSQAAFEASLIIDFVNSNRVSATFTPPGLFSAALGPIQLVASQSFSTDGASTATIESSIASVPEPASFSLLGIGLTGVIIWAGLRGLTADPRTSV